MFHRLKMFIKGASYLIVGGVLLSSCAEQYNIMGNSFLPRLNGQMLYLRSNVTANPKQAVDSCEVVHGQFNFFGEIDNAIFAQLHLGKECVIPIVLESGNMKITVDNLRQKVKGGKLNDRLYNFFEKRSKLEAQLWEIDQEYYQKLRTGRATETNYKDIQERAKKLVEKIEDLEARFIMDNYDNPLGPGYFLLLTEAYPTPVMTNQLQRIYDKAPKEFKQHPAVARFVKEARSNPFFPH